MTESEPEERSATTAPDDGGTESDADTGHLRNVPDGAGCAEIWEHLSEESPDNDADDAEA